MSAVRRIELLAIGTPAPRGSSIEVPIRTGDAPIVLVADRDFWRRLAALVAPVPKAAPAPAPAPAPKPSTSAERVAALQPHFAPAALETTVSKPVPTLDEAYARWMAAPSPRVALRALAREMGTSSDRLRAWFVEAGKPPQSPRISPERRAQLRALYVRWVAGELTQEKAAAEAGITQSPMGRWFRFFAAGDATASARPPVLKPSGGIL